MQNSIPAAQTILLVDDDAQLLNLYRAHLEQLGYSLLLATDSREALRICTATQPDLVLVDYLMPELNGLELVRRLRQDDRTAGIPVLMVTRLTDRETRLEALRAGVEDFLSKPVDEAELVARVRNALRLKRAQDALRMRNDWLEQQVDERTRTLLDNQQKVARLTRIYEVLSGINSAIVRIHDRERLLAEACRIAVAHGAFRSAWIGMIDQASGEGRVVAAAGSSDYFDKVRLTVVPDTPYSGRPACVALREARPVICQDIGKEDSLREVQQELAAKRHRSLAALPLIVEGKAVGVITLFAEEVGFFDELEMKLLNELAGDIAFGLQYIEKEERLNYLAFYDPLTGLPNRSFFIEQLSQSLTRARASSRQVAVIVGDIIRFRMVNESLGRNAGDELLREVARRLQQLARSPERLARTGSASFATILEDVDDLTGVAHLVERVADGASRPPFNLNGEELSVTLSTGVAVYPDDGASAEVLLKNAEAAMVQAKSAGQICRFYEPSIHARVAANLKLEHKLRQALEKEEFVLYYQPKVSSRTSETVGVEALLRWNDPETGVVQPLRFVPLLEETGLIDQVGQWLLRKALADLAGLREKGLAVPCVAVNVSIHQLLGKDFTGTIEAAVAASGLDASSLEIEITESLFMRDIDCNVRKLQAIRDQGVKIAIDDFGTGYSSLSYLAKLPVHTLKIDRSFTAQMTDSAEAMAIVSSVISLAHALNLRVVAEGVELEEQAKFLRLLKCDEMQGYYFGPPMPVDQLEDWLRQQHKVTN